MRPSHVLSEDTSIQIKESKKESCNALSLARSRFGTHRTLCKPLVFKGIGLHSGKKVSMTIEPSRTPGVFFVMGQSITADNVIPASWQHVCSTTLSTNLSNGTYTICTTEHILSALFMRGISAATIHLDNEEVPIMDGSAAPFLEEMEGVETSVKRPFLEILETVSVKNPQNFSTWATLEPYDGFKISAEIDFPDSKMIGHQKLTVDFYADELTQLIGDARTFVLEKNIPLLQERGLAQGGSLSNAVVIGTERVLNSEGLRHEDECVRHKVLDCIGDLALVGMPILGHLKTHRPGHWLNIQLIRTLFSRPGAYRLVYL